MANDVYLQIDGIKGESSDDKHKGWIEVSNVTWSVNQPRTTTMSTAGGHTTGRAELSNVSLKKLTDLSSPVRHLPRRHCQAPAGVAGSFHHGR